jgi:ribonuclease R
VALRDLEVAARHASLASGACQQGADLRHRLVGRRSNRVFALGDAVTATLVEADAIGGRLLFRIEDELLARPSPAAFRPRRGLYRRRR